MVNSATTRMDDTVRNLAYIGTWSMKKFVKPMKFLPHDNRIERIVAIIRAHLSGFLFGMMNNAKTNSIQTSAPT